jgi:ketosteroid isomerase-like protein
MLETEITRNLVRRLYDAVAGGDVSALSGLIHNDIDWIIRAVSTFYESRGFPARRE